MNDNKKSPKNKIRITQPLMGESFRYNKESTILDMIEQQAKSSTNRTAIKYQDDFITYQELLTRINQLANYLLEQGATQGNRIAVYLDPSIELIVGILAILKIGCAFVPLDTGYPHERLNFILKDSSAHLLITTSTLITRLAVQEVNCVALDLITKLPEISSIFPAVSSNEIAYVIYTSGSTGMPKGVCIHHQAVNNHMTWMQDRFYFNKTDIILLRTPISFDPSVWELLLPLYIGGTLVIAPAGTHLDPMALIQLIDEHHVTTIQFVPPIMHEFLKQKRAHQCHSLRRVFSGGESIRRETKLLYFAKFTCPLYNLYGPTETTIDITSYEVSPTTLNANFIGDPIYNNNLYVLDEALQFTDIDEPGELYIVGESVAKGYINRAAETTEKFIDNPFDRFYGEKLYKTGDIVKITESGVLEYIGRSNDQIKINGVRIEPTEIATHILQDSDIYDCKIVKKIDANGRAFLACYLTPTPGKTIRVDEIKERLHNFFPRYMLPKTYTVLERFPLKENGKIDSDALPEPKIVGCIYGNLKNKFDKPEEEKLYQIWQQILKVDTFDLSSTFFELGGDSILALELIAQIKNEFKVSFPIKDIFAYETVPEQIKVIEQLPQNDEKVGGPSFSIDNIFEYSMIPFRKRGHKAPLFLIHPIGGTVFWYSTLATLLDKSRPVYGIQDPALDFREDMFSSIREMAECYYAMIKKIQPHGPYIIGGASFGGTVAVEIAGLIENEGEEVLGIPILDGWAIYPDTLRDINYFESSMHRQYDYSMNQFLKQGLTDQQFLLGIQKNRLDLLWKFALRKINYTILLFKAAQTLPIFTEIEDPDNHWQKYSERTVARFIVPGDHETMFQFPNVKKLAFLLNQQLDLIEKNN